MGNKNNQRQKSKKVEVLFKCESTPITSNVVSPSDDTSCDIEIASLVKVEYLMLSTSEGRRKCVYNYIEDTMTLLQRLCESSLVSGEFLKSSEFSSIINKFVVLYGYDKYIDETRYRLRTANRRSGIQWLHLAIVENAEFSYDIMINTIFRDDSPVKEIAQLLTDNKLFLFCFSIKDKHEKIIRSKCKALNFFDHDPNDYMDLKDVSAELVEDSFINRDELEETLASPFESLKVGTDTHSVFTKVLRDKKSINGDYLGFKLYKESDDKTPFYCGKFEKPLIGANVSEDESLHINVMQAVGFVLGDLNDYVPND